MVIQSKPSKKVQCKNANTSVSPFSGFAQEVKINKTNELMEKNTNLFVMKLIQKHGNFLE